MTLNQLDLLYKFLMIALITIPFNLFAFPPLQVDTLILKNHVKALTETENFRNYNHIEQLNASAEYIFNVLSVHSTDVRFQEYTVKNRIYKNVIASFGPSNRPKVVIGAHYDVCGDQSGADDNASGVAGLLELARLLNGIHLQYSIELVAFTLEEPPYFRTQNMGSYVHAKSLFDNQAEVLGMISIEMIGYFSDDPKSQQYPLPILSLFYGKKGNYITLVRKFGAGKFTKQFNRRFKKQKLIKTKKFSAPAKLPGIDFSDHLNYWQFGYDAFMITDTSFYRNKNYHESTDTIETLDFTRMGKVIDSLFLVVSN